jgi:dienelactone hydrolase
MQLGALAASSAGTYTLVPDVIGNGEDWESVRSYVVKEVYQASAIPLLLKVLDNLEIKEEYKCTVLDKRVAIMGYSEGGYATVSIADAIDMLDDGYLHTYTGVGGAPLRLSSAQTKAVVEMTES